MNRTHIMNKSGLKIIAAFLLVFFLCASCAVNPVTGENELMLMSEEMEVQWGNEVYPSALWGEVGGGGVYHDIELETYLNKIVQSLHTVSHRPEIPTTFIIQNSSVPNAWAIPGHVAITRGLLSELENEAEFAFVMGHEMGHVSARHSAKRYTQQALMGIALAGGAVALQGEEGSDWMLSAGALGGSLFLLKYSREQELQADRLGVQYMAKAGYRPEEAVNAHKRLEVAVNKYLERVGRESAGGGFLEDLLSTHPRTEIRLEEVKKAAEIAAKTPLDGDGINSRRFMQKTAELHEVNKAYAYYDRALATFENKDIAEAKENLGTAIKMDDKQAPFYNLKGYIMLSEDDFIGAETAFNAALWYYKDFQPALHGMGITEYKRQRYKEAVAYLKRSLEIFPGNPLSEHALGMSYYRLDQFSEALPHLKAFEEAAPKHEEIHGYLGITYENVDDLNSAYAEYKAQVQVAPSNDMGRHASQRIEALRPIVEKK